MLDELLLLFLAVIISSLLYPYWINFVYRYQMGEQIRGDGPIEHAKKLGTPTMGGLVFIITVSLITFVFNRSRTQTLLPVFVASMAGLFGVIEDLSKIYARSRLPGMFRTQLVPVVFPTKASQGIYKALLIPWDLFKKFWGLVGSNAEIGLQTHQKFLIQACIGGFIAYWTYFKLGWDYLWFPLLGNIHLGLLYPVIIFGFFIIFLNFAAVTDGVDGLAGGLGLISFLALWVLATKLGYNSLGAFAATFIGALLPFLYFNIHPARIFMGNVGSFVLAASLFMLGVVMHREIALIFICGVFLLDGITSPLQQFSVKLTGKRLFRMAPIHHHFELLGWQETKVTLRFWLLGVLLSFIGIFIALL